MWVAYFESKFCVLYWSVRRGACLYVQTLLPKLNCRVVADEPALTFPFFPSFFCNGKRFVYGSATVFALASLPCRSNGRKHTSVHTRALSLYIYLRIVLHNSVHGIIPWICIYFLILKVSQDGNMTSSTLILKPTLLDHDKVITCRAENFEIQRGIVEDTWKLNVFCKYKIILYKIFFKNTNYCNFNTFMDIHFHNIYSFCFYFSVVPILHLELGSNMNPDDIEEGDDVYFECKVHANPGAYKVIWRHNVNFSWIYM